MAEVDNEKISIYLPKVDNEKYQYVCQNALVIMEPARNGGNWEGLNNLEVGIGVEVLVSDYFDWPRPAAGGNVHDAPLPNNLLLILIKHTDPKLLLIVDGLILPSIKTA